VVTHQLQVERRTAKAHRPKTNALPLDHATSTRAVYSAREVVHVIKYCHEQYFTVLRLIKPAVAQQ